LIGKTQEVLIGAPKWSHAFDTEPTIGDERKGAVFTAELKAIVNADTSGLQSTDTTSTNSVENDVNQEENEEEFSIVYV
jgi:hypothetical protein